MKRLLILFALVFGFMQISDNSANVAEAKAPAKDRVEIIYFHGKQRCPTCLAIEKNVREVVKKVFAEDVKNGKVVFRVVDFSTKEGEAIADKYEVAWSSLYVNRWKNGKESRYDMTKFAFANARNNPAVFRKGLADKIRQYLK